MVIRSRYNKIGEDTDEIQKFIENADKKSPNVSIIIPSLNSGLIDKTLESLFAQTCFNHILEIIVIGLDENHLIQEREPVRFISTVTPVTAPVARNIGIRESKGDILAFIDADCIADPCWLEKLLLAQNEGYCIMGGSITLDVKSYWQLCYNLTMFHEFLVSKTSGERLNFGTLNLARILTWLHRKPLVLDVFMSIYLIAMERGLTVKHPMTGPLIYWAEKLAVFCPIVDYRYGGVCELVS